MSAKVDDKHSIEGTRGQLVGGTVEVQVAEIFSSHRGFTVNDSRAEAVVEPARSCCVGLGRNRTAGDCTNRCNKSL
jgi:hypothetical protein